MANFVQISTAAGADYVPADDFPELEEDLPELKDETKTMAEVDGFIKPFPRLEPADHPTVRELFARFKSSGARFYPHTTCVDLPSHRWDSYRYIVFPEDNKLKYDPLDSLSSERILDDPVPEGDQVNQEDVYSAYAFWNLFIARANVLQIIVNVYKPCSSQ
jgi:hypothetical protein